MRSRQFLTVSLAISALAGAAFCGPAAAAAPPDGVYMSLQFPSDVGMDVLPPIDDDRTESPTASVNIANLTNTHATWQVDSACDADTWTVTDPAGTVIDSHDPCPPGGTPVTETLTGGQQSQAQTVIPLHVFKYQENTTYTLHYTYWGATKDATFTIHHEQ